MSGQSLYPVNANQHSNAHIDQDTYQRMYRESVENPANFWAQQAQQFLSWSRDFSANPNDIMCYDFHQGHIAWFKGGELNVSYNCIDRHLATRAEQTAIIWESDDGTNSQHISYGQLHRAVCKMANVLKSRGVKKGDRVSIYMPMIPEAAYAMLACTRIGAVHSVVFGGFSPNALADRILDANCQLVITADEGVRGGKAVALKANVDEAVARCPDVTTVLVVKHTGADIPMHTPRDVWYHDLCDAVDDDCEAQSMQSEDPLFILYTSGSTGKPKGVLHTTAGYLLYCAVTHKYVFDYHENDVYWCTADVGWITGHSYSLYGPLANGATTLLFEGIPTYPDASRCWQIVDKYKVNIFYTAPTAIRALMGLGNQYVESCDLSSLRILGTVGEPINPEAWQWYYEVVGQSKCAIVDTWWQTETGGHMITPLPAATPLKPGSATTPFFGVVPALMDSEGNELSGEASGNLVIKQSWPGQMRGVYGDQQRFIDTYFSMYPGYYTTGDGARRDADGYYWITGRIDDVINVSGHRLGTAEIESALVLHEAVAEAAVVGREHDVKGQCIYAYVTLMQGVEPSDALKHELNQLVRKEIGAIANIEHLQWAPALPKTRSGKIMRRILRKIAAGETDSLGDTSTLAEPQVVQDLIANRLA